MIALLIIVLVVLAGYLYCNQQQSIRDQLDPSRNLQNNFPCNFFSRVSQWFSDTWNSIFK
ncbi:hypothetical protein JYU34_001500 [Plutella xylostella]|uniref:Uncharacterized protein n=1 Tax=Plutella xylostella TaxID=51655 RepID=A0ABQ7R427_PLUXY|nr:hypothetical protein JYU34_001500 [Plutella xylostella]